MPEEGSADVPLDTGIEVTFDQDGIVDAASHVTISPAIDGRFEQHERTIVFVPARPLKPATIYSVEVSRGVTVEQTGEASVDDTRFRFETAATATSSEDPTFTLQGELIESAVANRPVIGLWYEGAEDEAPAPTTTPVEVYRLTGLEAGIDAFWTIRARPEWSRWSTEGRLFRAVDGLAGPPKQLDVVTFGQGRSPRGRCAKDGGQRSAGARRYPWAGPCRSGPAWDVIGMPAMPSTSGSRKQRTPRNYFQRKGRPPVRGCTWYFRRLLQRAIGGSIVGTRSLGERSTPPSGDGH